MNATSILIANLPEAGLATVTGGSGWAVSWACMVVAAMVDTIAPGLGGLIALTCYFPV